MSLRPKIALYGALAANHLVNEGTSLNHFQVSTVQHVRRFK